MTDTDIDRFLDSMSVLLRTKRSVVSTDTWPTLEYETPKDLLENFSYFQNRATFQRFRSTEPFAFRGKPTATERALWRAAFTRGWNDPRALSRLAEMWAQEPELSDAASLWLFDELTGEDAFGADFGSDPVAELRDQLDALRGLVASAGTVTSCEPMPSFVSRVSHIPLHVTGTSGESLNSTLPKDALDGIFDPELGKGWRVRPDGRPVQLDVGFEAPTSVASVRMVVRPVDGAVARARLLGRDEHETWLREHLPSEAVVFHTANLPAGATVTLTIDNANANADADADADGEKTGIISDFGPARTVFGLDRIALVEATDRTITVRFDGYDGLYYIATLPARAPVRVFIENDGKPVDTVSFIGPMQLPLDTAGRAIAPDECPSFFVSDKTPTLRKTDAPALQIWWHPYGEATSPDDGANPLTDFDRVLREWGYIR